jgi:hypothetical protein
MEPATNGLGHDDEKMLQTCLRKLEAFDQRRCMLGSEQATAIVNLMREIRTRLNPPNPQDLQERCDRIVAGLRPDTVAWAGAVLASVTELEGVN